MQFDTSILCLCLSFVPHPNSSQVFPCPQNGIWLKYSELQEQKLLWYVGIVGNLLGLYRRHLMPLKLSLIFSLQAVFSILDTLLDK